ncbi:MAG: hypothetical protein WC279_13935 [Sulfurimonas sp.]|jgi:hypothetical protein|uniref:hypothetical protein n=1 Tax=Sulfurimonas sp. TaxID=2022749 RepID=UPI003568FBCF
MSDEFKKTAGGFGLGAGKRPLTAVIDELVWQTVIAVLVWFVILLGLFSIVPDKELLYRFKAALLVSGFFGLITAFIQQLSQRITAWHRIKVFMRQIEKACTAHKEGPAVARVLTDKENLVISTLSIKKSLLAAQTRLLQSITRINGMPPEEVKQIIAGIPGMYHEDMSKEDITAVMETGRIPS